MEPGRRSASRGVAFVEGPADVAKVIRFAAEHDLKVTAQGTGHGAAPLGPLEDAILIETERMRGIEVDPEARTARVEAGVLARGLSSAAQAEGSARSPRRSPRSSASCDRHPAGTSLRRFGSGRC